LICRAFSLLLCQGGKTFVRL